MTKLLREVRDRLDDEQGLSILEWVFGILVVVGLLAFVTPLRNVVADVYTDLIWDSVMARGILITVVAFVVFPGSVWLILYTDLGMRLSFLVAGAALTGWSAINSLLFVMYAPRGPRPPDVEGLNAFQIRIMPGAMLLGSLVLFIMFLIALSRLERTAEEQATS